MTLLHPTYLLLLLLLIPVWIGPWRSRAGVQGLLRSGLVTLVALALARPVVVREGAAPTRVWVLDRSNSVSPEDAAATETRLQTLVESTGAGRNVLVTVGAPAPDVLTSTFDRVVTLTSDGPDGASPLGAALRRAVAEIPMSSRGRVTVMSDGLATSPDDGRVLALYRERDIALDVVPQMPRATAVRPVNLAWRGELRVGASTPLTIALAGSGASSRVVLSDASGPLAEVDTGPIAGRAEIVVPFEPSEAGFQRVAVRVDGGDETTWTLPIQDPRRLLYVGDRQQGGAARLGELLGPGFELLEPDSTDEYVMIDQVREADLVLIDDAPADRVPESVQRAIIDAVADDGLGLVMAGGRASFGAGGWHETAVETVLPVELVQKEEKRDPSTTLVVVIDTSGSMGGTRVQLAKEVARLAIRRLMPHDKVGIVEFYGAKRWAAPIQPASNRIEIERALNRLDAGGGTVILPAIEESFYGLQNIDSRYKHVLVLTDGGVEAGAFEPLLRRMADEGINVSSVLVGGRLHSEFLVNLANWGRGRFYGVPNRFNLPEIIFKQPSSAKLPAWRQGEHAVRARGGPGWWGAVDATTVPALAGYVETRTRPGAEVLLETVEASHPIVSTWRWGLGRVTAIATEPVGDGTASWRAWADYGQSLARLLERTAADGRAAFRYTVASDGPELVVHAQRLIPETTGLLPVLHRFDDNGDRVSVALESRTPDRWTTRLVAPAVGDVIRLEGSDSRGGDAAGQRLVGRATTVDEMRVDPAHAFDLDALRRQTGGDVLALGPSQNVAAGGLRVWSLAPLLLSCALVLFVGELAWRRRP